MKQHLSAITLLVRDYDEAIAFYVGKLGFKLIEDTRLSPTKRWVLIAMPGARETRLLLAKAVGARQRARVGDQTGGRVFLFLRTDDFKRDHARFRARGVTFIEKPRREKYGTVAVFEDLYGNQWDLIQPATRGTRR
jgi:catechol 2,3-dioxygenase-like lactoylglutathione lyase family enzyme